VPPRTAGFGKWQDWIAPAAGFHRIGGRIIAHRECASGCITLQPAPARFSIEVAQNPVCRELPRGNRTRQSFNAEWRDWVLHYEREGTRLFSGTAHTQRALGRFDRQVHDLRVQLKKLRSTRFLAFVLEFIAESLLLRLIQGADTPQCERLW
jgi:hypothetical protein